MIDRKQKSISMTVMALFVSVFFMSTGALAGQDYPASVRNVPSIKVAQNGEVREITLCEVFDFHGGACPGATMAYMAVRYAFDLLYEGGEVPDPDELVVFGRAPGGPLDMLDVVMKGGGHASRTWPPPGISRGAGNFQFQFLRKSTMQAVDIRLQDGLWPDDWFELRDKHQAGTITEAESEKRKRDRQNVIREFPNKSFQELFGTPELYTFIAWGHMEQGEMDRLGRDLRRQQRDE
jgi:hypothetical protein